MSEKSRLRVRVEGDRILVSDPRLRSVPPTTIDLQRTLRIPDDGHEWPLPPGLGRFPIRTVASLGERAPGAMRERGGLIVPIYQAEALWLSFHAPHWRPMAMKVGAGMVNAVNADSLDGEIRAGRADYLVTPPQPWLDGFKTGEDTISQFVAMPLGSGTTVEGQLTGEERIGGIQMLAAGPRPGKFRTTPPPPPPASRRGSVLRMRGMGAMDTDGGMVFAAAAAPAGMGLGAGGRMTQKVYPDPHGVATWDAERAARIWIHLVPAPLWHALTGEPRPATPADTAAYQRYGLPWYAIYDEPAGDVPVDPRWAKVKTVQELTGDDPDGTTGVENASW